MPRIAKRRAPGRKAESLTREDWIAAALESLGNQGIDSVRVERLARRLGVTKGSFYWHFRNRPELLDALVSAWETRGVNGATSPSQGNENAADRWVRLLETVLGLKHSRLDVAMFAWARLDELVARRVAEVERQRVEYISSVFHDVGFEPAAAADWAVIAMLLYLGWVDRATRDPEFVHAGPALSDVLSQLVLAASSLGAEPSHGARHHKR